MATKRELAAARTTGVGRVPRASSSPSPTSRCVEPGYYRTELVGEGPDGPHRLLAWPRPRQCSSRSGRDLPSSPLDVDAMNEEFFEANRDSRRVVRAERPAARTRMLQEWALLAEITREPRSGSWNRGPAHYARALPRLRRMGRAS